MRNSLRKSLDDIKAYLNGDKSRVTETVYDVEFVCINGHDRCYEGPFEGCPYCERRATRRP
jgi:hypothetical protein